MAYDKKLLERVRKTLRKTKVFEEKKMFGGVCFLLNGNMAFGIHENNMMIRVGKEKYEEALKQKHAKEMDFTGRPMRGMVTVLNKGLESEDGLKRWIKMGIDFAGSLPSK